MSARLFLLVAAAAMALAGCERPPMQSDQQGYRGTGMVQIDNPRIEAARAAARVAPPEAPASVPSEGPRARDVFQNVKVLGDLSAGEFTRLMLAITSWVAPPDQGCTYCHGGNLADDGKYTKVVARRMLEMTRQINAERTAHVGQTGVTCWTCHRGQPVPEQVWFTAPTPKNNRVGPGLGDDAGQNKGVPSIATASLPYDPYTAMLGGGDDGADGIRVQTETALPSGNRQSIKQAEFTYSLMNHMSLALGENCTFCHNTQSFQHWNDKRVTAWHGIRMVRDLNAGYLTPLKASFPPERLGPTGDVAKVYCGTCHQGQNKPVGGLAMAAEYAGLVASKASAEAALPPPVAEAKRAVLYFGVGSASLEGSQRAALGALAEALKANARAQASISGFHSAAGTLAQNQELAKQRAIAVRDALKAAGVAEARLKLDKPQQTVANNAGEETAARRVEVTLR